MCAVVEAGACAGAGGGPDTLASLVLVDIAKQSLCSSWLAVLAKCNQRPLCSETQTLMNTLVQEN